MDGRIDDGLRYLRIDELGKTDERVLAVRLAVAHLRR
jgi:hypothetical protein